MSFALPASDDPWWPSLVSGYYEQQSVEIFAGLDQSQLSGEKGRVEQILRATAVELMTKGAVIRNLSGDQTVR